MIASFQAIEYWHLGAGIEFHWTWMAKAIILGRFAIFRFLYCPVILKTIRS
jgi:hypothetical protein